MSAGFAGALLWVCLFPYSFIASGSHPSVPVLSRSNNVEQAITKLERNWATAIVNNDTDTLNRLLAKEFNGTTPNGNMYTKEMAIADLKSGVYVVEKMRLDGIWVNVYGETAVAFISQEEKSRYGTKDSSGHYYYTDVWVRKNGRWQVVASHGSATNDFAPDSDVALDDDC
jgi:hypothetical protein